MTTVFLAVIIKLAREKVGQAIRAALRKTKPRGAISRPLPIEVTDKSPTNEHGSLLKSQPCVLRNPFISERATYAASHTLRPDRPAGRTGHAPGLDIWYVGEDLQASCANGPFQTTEATRAAISLHAPQLRRGSSDWTESHEGRLSPSCTQDAAVPFANGSALGPATSQAGLDGKEGP